MSATGRNHSARMGADNYPTPAWCVRLLLDHWRGAHACGIWLEPCVGEGAIVRAVAEWCGAAPGRLQPPLWGTCDVRDVPEAKMLDYAHQSVRDACADRMQDPMPPEHWASVAITNPPYSLAEPIIRNMLRDAREVAVLTRLGFLASAKRAEWLRAEPPDVWVLPNRPSFAVSVHCIGERDGMTGHQFEACGWAALYHPDVIPPRTCPVCQSPVGVTRTDASDYCWLTWPEPIDRARPHGRIVVLPALSKEERKP